MLKVYGACNQRSAIQFLNEVGAATMPIRSRISSAIRAKCSPPAIKVRTRRSPRLSATESTRSIARDEAQTVAYDVRFLVEAALTLNANGADDGPIEQGLMAAKDKLVAHANALDSVLFGKAP